jgi:thymidylate synthase
MTQVVEDRNLTIYNTIKAWLSMVRDPLTQKSAGKFIYGVIANLHLYDEQLEEIQAQSMAGFFPHDMPDINLDNTTAQLVDVTVQFKYDIPTSNYGGV